MTNSKVLFAATFLTVACAVGSAGLAHALDGNITVANRQALCTSNLQANTKLVESLKAAKDEDTMRALLTPPVKANPANAMCIMDAVKAQAPQLSRVVFQIIIALLGGDPANDALVRRLSEENQDIIASIAADVEPAGGPGGTGNTQDSPFGDGANPENPNQLNGEGATTPPASPSNP